MMFLSSSRVCVFVSYTSSFTLITNKSRELLNHGNAGAEVTPNSAVLGSYIIAALKTHTAFDRVRDSTHVVRSLNYCKMRYQ